MWSRNQQILHEIADQFSDTLEFFSQNIKTFILQ